VKHLGDKIIHNFHKIPEKKDFVFTVFREPYDRARSVYRMYKEHPDDCPFKFNGQVSFFENAAKETRKDRRRWLGSPQHEWIEDCPPDLILRFEDINWHFPGLPHLRQGIPIEPLSVHSKAIIRDMYKGDFRYARNF